MRNNQLRVISYAQLIRELIFLEGYIDIYRSLYRLIFNGLRGVGITICVHGITEERDIIQQRIRCIRIRIDLAHGIHVCVIVVAIGGRCDLGDDESCVIRDRIGMLQRCCHGDIDVAVGVLRLLAVVVLDIQSGIALKLRIIIGAVLLYLVCISVIGLHTLDGRDVDLFTVLSDIGRFVGVLFDLLPAVILRNLQFLREAVLQCNLVLIFCKRNRDTLLILVDRITELIDILCRKSCGGVIFIIGKDNGLISADGDRAVCSLCLRNLCLLRYDISGNGLFLSLFGRNRSLVCCFRRCILIAAVDADGIFSGLCLGLDLAVDL